MKNPVNTRTRTLAQQLLSGLLVIVVIVMLGWLSVRYSFEQDWTYGNRNTISEASQRQLESMKDPIRLIAFAYPGAPERSTVEFFFDQYARFKDDITLEFVDPSTQPQKVKEYDISFAGELVVEYQGRRETLRALSEQNLTTALQRLSYSEEKWIVFTEGHGERVPLDGQTQADFNRFAEVLGSKGLKVQPLSLVKSPAIPDNTSVLVIASPRSDMLPGEIDMINRYVEDGGNLLWLADPDNPTGLQKLADTLGIEWQEGYAVFPEYELLGTGHPGIFAALEYPANPVTRGLNQVTLFPLVRSVTAKADSGWIAQEMLTSSPASWLETQPIDEAGVALDEDKGDIPGPLTIGLSLTRNIGMDASKGDDGEAPSGESDEEAASEPRQQRVVVIGDADFLSDASISQLGNQSLGLNILQWLASRDTQLNIDIPEAPDTSLFLPQWAVIALSLGFVVVLPILLIGIGVGRWILRRRR